MNYTEILKKLNDSADEKYRKFHSGLVPDIKNFLGVRMPVLRKIAKQILQDDPQAFLRECRHILYEEEMLCGVVTASMKGDASASIARTADFLPHIDNWAVCDCTCASYRIAEQDLAQWFAFLEQCAGDRRVFHRRFAAVMLLNHFCREDWLDSSLSLLTQMKQSEYYVMMGIAWALSVFYVKFPQRIEPFLRAGSIDALTYKKSLQKILESRRASAAQKEIIRAMKRECQ